jgi:hypothetical protein
MFCEPCSLQSARAQLSAALDHAHHASNTVLIFYVAGALSPMTVPVPDCAVDTARNVLTAAGAFPCATDGGDDWDTSFGMCWCRDDPVGMLLRLRFDQSQRFYENTA